MATSSLSILYSITSLASFLLSASGFHFSLCMMILTLDLFLWLFATYLAALLCTASTLFISACVYGSQTVLAYSTSGRARVKYACSFILIDGIFRFLRRKPRVLFALLVIQFMCWSHCNLFVNVRPKYLADVTDSSVCPWSWYLASIIFFLFVGYSENCAFIRVEFHAPFIFHSFSQCPSLSRSFCRVSASLLLDIVRYAIVSSAESLTVDVSLDCRSFM